MNDAGEATATRRPAWLPVLRRVAGAVLLVAAAVGAVLYVLGSWNPADLVFLEYTFGNPTHGLLFVPIVAFFGFWLALPVQNETRQRWRGVGRWVSAALAVVGLLAWGVFGDHFTFEAEELARSPDGERALALIHDRDTPPNSYLRVWAGSGLLAREVGEIGRVCGSVQVRFITDDQVEVDSSYGTWAVDLDPNTGVPLQVLGRRCSDGPIPATMGAVSGDTRTMR